MDIKPCPMCGSSAEMDCTAAIECYGRDWQTLCIECTKENDPKCWMSLSLNYDAFYVNDSITKLISCWNSLKDIK